MDFVDAYDSGVVERGRVRISFEELQARFDAAGPPRRDDVNSAESTERIEGHRDGLARELWRVFGYDPDDLPL